jgi:hypothetical protein
MARYFRYEFHSLCGVPEITLEGTPDDWRSLRRRARALEEYELGWWTGALGPVLDRIVDTAEGRVDVPFWESLFKHVEGSGGPWVQGWINVLFPYLRPGKDQALVRNAYLATWRKGLSAAHGGGPAPSSIPSGLSRVPFEWHHVGKVFPMCFCGGFVGVAQDGATLAVRPAIGWGVGDDVAIPAPSPEDLRQQAFAESAVLELPCAIMLVAGRASGGAWMTPGEIGALMAEIDRVAAGAQLFVVVAGDVTYAGELPEAPIRCHVVVGALVGSVSYQNEETIGPVQLRRALDAAGAVPDTVWRAIEALVPGGLGQRVALHLAASGSELRGEARFRGTTVATVATRGPTLAVVDLPSLMEAGPCLLSASYDA